MIVSREMKRLGMIALVAVVMTTAETLAEDARPFTRAELYAYLSDKTQVWSEGGIFYSGAGKLQTLRDGGREKGTWSTDDDGTLCWHVISWGEVPCEIYYHNGDAVSVVYEGKTSPAPEMQDGNTLDNLAPGSERFSREKTLAFLSGKTVIRGPSQGLYYAPDFTLEKIWNGVRGTGTWSVSEEGAVCWQVPGWGITPCESYYYNDDELMAVVKGEHSKANEPVEGNKIGSF